MRKDDQDFLVKDIPPIKKLHPAQSIANEAKHLRAHYLCGEPLFELRTNHRNLHHVVMGIQIMLPMSLEDF